MKQIKSVLVYLGTFAFARGILFLAPLGLANLLPTTAYAQMEWAYATGTILSTLLTLGTAALVPVLVLSKAPPPDASIVGARLHHLCIAVLCLCVALVGWNSAPVWQVALMCGVIALQGLFSTELKTWGKANASLMVDAGLFASMVLGCAATHWLAPANVAAGAWIPVSVMLLLLGWRLTAQVVPADLQTSQWRGSVLAGFPLMLTGITAVLITSSGRAGAGYFIGDEGAALYAVLSRGAALPIVAHQVILVARFRMIFEIEERRLQPLLLGILALVALSASAFWVFRPVLSLLLGPAFAEAADRHASVLGWLLAQSVLWSAIALNDLVNTRRQIASAVLRTSIPALVAALATAVFAVHVMQPTPEGFVRAHGLAVLFFYCAQSLTMWKLGTGMPKLWLSVIACYVLICGMTTSLPFQ